MKKLFVLFFVVLLVPVLSFGLTVMPVIDSSLNALIAGTWVEEAIYFAQMVANDVQQITHLATQVDYTIKSYEKAAKNLATIGDVKSWDDFWDWHNRQLYLERMSEDAFNNMNVTVGSKNYSIFDVEGIASGAREDYVDFWDKEFTEDQRREMWIGLGLTPANYAYVQTWQAREQELARLFLAGTAVQNAEYVKSMADANDKKIRLKIDKDKGENGEIDDKEMQAMQIELLIDIFKSLSDLNMSVALQNELTAVQMRLNDTPAEAPLLSDWKGTEGVFVFGDSDTIIIEE